MLNNKEICLWLIGYPGVYLYVTFSNGSCFVLNGVRKMKKKEEEEETTG